MLPKGIACNKGASWNTNTAQYQMIYRIDKAKVKGKYKKKNKLQAMIRNRYHVRSNFWMTKSTKTIHWPVLQKDIFENWWKSF